MVGHKSNSKADEIGKAMQKASASATEAGLSFEWLGAYIATVSEKTRQAPEVIGTAYNSIIARLHNIKAKGFNEEDETKINDIAKALASLPEPLKLIDSMTGEWMSMSEIFSSIAAQWSNLDDKQRAYIATTMAGSRQQNVFITLMNDMAKGLEGGSRAYELYTGAQTSAGNATQKYAVYQESLTALQEKSTAKWEEFYNTVVNVDVLKGFYSFLGNIADLLTAVTRNTDGWNLKIVALSASLFGVLAVVLKIRNALNEAGGMKSWFAGLTATSKVGLVITGQALLAEVIASVVSAYKDAEQASIDYSETISSKSSLIESVKPLIEEYEQLSQKTIKTVEEQKRMDDLFIQISGSSRGFSIALDGLSSSVDNGSAALKAMNDELDRQNKLLLDTKAVQARADMVDSENISLWTSYIDNYRSQQDKKQQIGILEALGVDTTGTFDSFFSDIESLRFNKQGQTNINNIAYLKEILDTLNIAYRYIGGSFQIDKDTAREAYNQIDYMKQNEQAAQEQVEAMVESLMGYIIDSNYDLFDGATLGQKSFMTDTLKSLLNTMVKEMLYLDSDIPLDERILSVQKDFRNQAIDILSNNNSEGKYISNLFDSVFGTSEQWRQKKDEILADIESSWTSDEIQTMIDNVNKMFAGDESGQSSFWDNFLNGSFEDRDNAILRWQNSLNGIVGELEELASEALSDELNTSMFLNEGENDGFDLFAEELLNSGYKPEEIASFMKRLKDALVEAPEIWNLQNDWYNWDGMGENPLETIFGAVTNETLDDYLSSQRAQTEGTLENWQKFFEDIGELSASDEEGMGSFLAKMIGADEESLENLAQAFSALDSEAQKALKESSGFSKEFWEDVADGGEMSADSIKELDRAQSRLNIKKEARYFDKTADAIAGLADGSVDATEAFESFNDETDAQNNALTEYEAGTKKLSQGMELTTDDVQTLADYLSTTPENIMNSWDSVGTLLTSAITEGSNALSVLRDNAFINIVGTSSVDFSAVYSGLLDVKAVGEEAAAVLATLGMFKIETKTMPYDFTTMGQNGEQIHYKGNSTANVLVPTGNNPFKGSSVSKPSSGGGGGGGGGGGSSKVDNTADEQKLVDNMTWQIESVDRRMAQLNAIMSKYETEGYLTGIINCLKMENDLLGEQNTLYQNNLITLDGKLKSLRSQLSGLTPGTAEYDDVLAQIAILQDAYSEYTLALLENEAAQAENAEAMKEQEKAIRQLEIDLRDELLQAIEDREAREEEALEARIEMEETLMDIIRKRYEEERDQILKNTELQIESLEREKDALDEALEARREAEEEQDRAAELAELEAQYARIIADPTRAKEAQEIRNKINDLRDEIAWDTAEKEVEAQQESLDQQITSLEDYAEYIENYYDELLENPQNFIAEVNSILNQSQEDILTWLKENSEEYATATEATQKQITDGWTETLNSMHGVIETHWAEIENIIAQGDEAILKFLMDNRQDYAEAGKLQAEAYVDAWKEQLEDLDRAYKDLVPKVTDDKKTNTTATSTGSGGSSGGGGGSSGGGSGSGSANQTKTEPKKQGLWKFTFDGKESFGFSSASSAHNAINQSEAAYAQWYYNKYKTEYNADTIADTANGIAKAKANNARKTLTEYRRGGIADFTGPAWVDGTKTNPERILTPYQTKLFEDMIATLHRIDKVRIPSLPAISDVGNGNGGNSFNFGDIILNVDKLSDDEDFEEVAEKICAYVVDRMNRGSSIGGIRQTK